MFLRVVIILAKSVFIHAALLQITCEHIKRFVDGHNRVRLAVAQGKVANQPAGTNLKLIMWDEELAQKASKWAERNVLQHDRDMTVPSKRFLSGENLCLHRSFVSKSTFNPDETIKVWYDEHEKYRYDKMSPNGFTSIGHYTQMIWADTLFIGCGIFQSHDGQFYTFLVVCNYGPVGNYMGQYPYDTQGRKTNGLLCNRRKYNCSNPYGKKCR